MPEQARHLVNPNRLFSRVDQCFEFGFDRHQLLVISL
jgi:hypothetical protein